MALCFARYIVYLTNFVSKHVWFSSRCCACNILDFVNFLTTHNPWDCWSSWFLLKLAGDRQRLGTVAGEISSQWFPIKSGNIFRRSTSRHWYSLELLSSKACGESTSFTSTSYWGWLNKRFKLKEFYMFIRLRHRIMFILLFFFLQGHFIKSKTGFSSVWIWFSCFVECKLRD